ncbi:MAG: YegS/Rv2252/BmrU family lipid kinase [Olegusella sp.]|nr:YegS/Rv2252/BmrU family lipid kinase [Olegusella sp.]
MQTRLGSTIVIANPTAHSGKGGHAAELTGHFFESYTSATDNFNLCLTTRAGEATEIAGAAGGTDTVVALGGDGVIHEVINGLMRISPDARPRLGVIAMGSGNDFARTLGVPFNDPEESLHSLLRAQETSYDLGLVDAGTPDARYFMETLSFGLDAAIALDTTDRRIAQTKQQGAGLFVTSGIRIMSQAHRGWPYRAVLVDTEGTRQVLVGTEVIFAIQNGPTYGGGFRIAPDASPTDGLLDLCRNTDIPAAHKVLGLFGLAHEGRHAGSRHVAFHRLTHLEIEFTGEEPPTQVDGERLTGASHTVDVVPGTLRVLAGRPLTRP